MSISILCPTDFSSSAACAVELAAEIARVLPAEIDLLHVDDVPLLAVPKAQLSVNGEYIGALRNKLSGELNAQRDLLQARGLSVRALLCEGLPAALILDHAKQRQPALIVMGTHGRSGVHFVLGSVAERVVRTATIPVLTTRAAEQLSPAATLPIVGVLVGYDFSEASNRAVKYAGSLAAKLGAVLHVAHVHAAFSKPSGPTTASTPWPTSEQTDRYLRFLHDELKRRTDALLPGHSGKVECHVLHGDAHEKLEQAAEDAKVGMVCVGASGQGAVQRVLLGSVAQRVLRTSRFPVLTVP